MASVIQSASQKATVGTPAPPIFSWIDGDETYPAGTNKELRTNGNDCDGATDEHIAVLGSSCIGTGLAQCTRTGTNRCQADKTLTAACDLTGVPIPTASDEVCDGLTDEAWDNPWNLGLPLCASAACKGVRDSVVKVNGVKPNYYMYSYEAVRLATSASNCGLCGVPCTGGKTCKNGSCR